MQVVTSISLQTPPLSVLFAPLPGAAPACPEMVLISKADVGMASSNFLDLHQEALEFRCVCIGIDGRRRQQIGQSARRPVLIFSDPPITPVNRYANLISLLTIDHHRLDAPCNKGSGNVMAARAGNFDFLSAAQPHLIGE